MVGVRITLGRPVLAREAQRTIVIHHRRGLAVRHQHEFHECGRFVDGRLQLLDDEVLRVGAQGLVEDGDDDRCAGDAWPMDGATLVLHLLAAGDKHIQLYPLLLYFADCPPFAYGSCAERWRVVGPIAKDLPQYEGKQEEQ